MKQSQLLKGVLEGCVLLILAEEEVYGYEMVQKLKAYGFEDMTGGTIYPLLQKLEKNGVLTSNMRPSADGPDRKYYTLTTEGAESGKQFIEQWQQLTDNVEKIIEKKEGYLHDRETNDR